MEFSQTGWARLNSLQSSYVSQGNHGFLTGALNTTDNILSFISHLAGGRRHRDPASAALGQSGRLTMI
jgi:hypothetical protein